MSAGYAAVEAADRILLDLDRGNHVSMDDVRAVAEHVIRRSGRAKHWRCIGCKRTIIAPLAPKQCAHCQGRSYAEIRQ